MKNTMNKKYNKTNMITLFALMSGMTMGGLVGCVSVPDVKPTKIAQPKDFHLEKREGLENAAPNNYIYDAQWWNKFPKSSLNTFINSTLKNNYDLQINENILNKLLLNKELAADGNSIGVSTYYLFQQSFLHYDIQPQNFNENVNILNALNIPSNPVTNTVGSLLPPINQQVSADLPPKNSVQTTNQFGLRFGYEMDFMDKYKKMGEAADSQILSKKYEIENLKKMLVNQLVKNYYQYQYLLSKKDVLEQQNTILSQLKEAQITGEELGLLKKDERVSIENQQITLKKNIIELNNALSVLKKNIEMISGNSNPITKEQNPFSTIADVANNTEQPVSDNDLLNKNFYVWNLSKIPVDLVSKREDVNYYLMIANSQKSQLAAIQTAFYPSIGILGTAGYSTVNITNLFSSNGLFYGISPTIHIPLFEKNKLTLNYKIAGYDLDIFIDKYNQSLNNAILDVNNKLFLYKNYKEELLSQQTIYKNYINAYKNNNQRYSLGYISKTQLLKEKFNLLSNCLAYQDNLWTLFDAQASLIGSIGNVLPSQKMVAKK